MIWVCGRNLVPAVGGQRRASGWANELAVAGEVGVCAKSLAEVRAISAKLAPWGYHPNTAAASPS